MINHGILANFLQSKMETSKPVESNCLVYNCQVYPVFQNYFEIQYVLVE